MKRKTTVLALLFYLFTITVNAQTSSQPAKFEFSVQQCIDYGVKNNVQVKNALLDYNIQEQTNNIVKHAKAKHVIISLRATKGSINLEITDDGQGFNLKKTKKGVGLTNIINRAELFNGQVEINTGQGKGCTIKVSIPLGN